MLICLVGEARLIRKVPDSLSLCPRWPLSVKKAVSKATRTSLIDSPISLRKNKEWNIARGCKKNQSLFNLFEVFLDFSPPISGNFFLDGGKGQHGGRKKFVPQSRPPTASFFSPHPQKSLRDRQLLYSDNDFSPSFSRRLFWTIARARIEIWWSSSAEQWLVTSRRKIGSFYCLGSACRSFEASNFHHTAKPVKQFFRFKIQRLATLRPEMGVALCHDFLLEFFGFLSFF